MAESILSRLGYEEETERYAVLGLFIQHYAIVERTIHILFRFATGMSDDAARTISGGMRVSDLMSAITKLAKARNLGEEFSSETAVCFDQLNAISKFRDTLIHRGTSTHDDGGLVSTNIFTAKTPEAVEVLKFDLEDIASAIDDCHRLCLRLERLTFAPDHWARSPGVVDLLGEPWSYRHRQPDTPLRPHRSKPE
ncbi:MAG TPA: hypothetical protein VJ798_01915 [Rhizomicrobium sp.]|nr:hypothetical protein [Rhizomicrobium sp.]